MKIEKENENFDVKGNVIKTELKNERENGSESEKNCMQKIQC